MKRLLALAAIAAAATATPAYAANTEVLNPTGDGVISGWDSPEGSNPLASAIDDYATGLHDGDTTRIRGANNAAATGNFSITDVSGSFDPTGVSSVTLTAAALRASSTVKGGADIVSLYAQLQKPGGGALTDEVLVAAPTSASYVEYTVALTNPVLTATQADWANAELKLRQAWTPVDAADGTSRLRVTAANVSVTWTQTNPCVNPTIVGTNGNDTINGTAGPDVIDGLDGVDVISGAGGNDIICGGEGGTYGNAGLSGGGGDDYIYDGSGNSFMWGNAGNDHLYGGGGDDNLKGKIGDDYVNGQDGNDFVCGDCEVDGSGNPVVGNDEAHGGAGLDTLDTGRGNDFLYGEADDDELVAGKGDDYLDGGPGTHDVCNGGNDEEVVGDVATTDCEPPLIGIP